MSESRKFHINIYLGLHPKNIWETLGLSIDVALMLIALMRAIEMKVSLPPVLV